MCIEVHRCAPTGQHEILAFFVLLIAACAAFRTYAQHAVSLRRT